MTIDLDRDVADFVQQQMKAGVCADPKTLVNSVLRSLRQQQSQPFEATPELEAWLLESAESPATPWKPEDLEAIRERVRKRIKPAGE